MEEASTPILADRPLFVPTFVVGKFAEGLVQAFTFSKTKTFSDDLCEDSAVYERLLIFIPVMEPDSLVPLTFRIRIERKHKNVLLFHVWKCIYNYEYLKGQRKDR